MALLRIYNTLIKPKIKAAVVLEGISPSDVRLIIVENDKYKTKLAQAKEDMDNDKIEYVDSILEKLRHGMRNNYELELSSKISCRACPVDGKVCPSNEFIKTASIGAYISMMYSITRRVREIVLPVMKRDKSFPEDEKLFKLFSDSISAEIDEMAEDTMRDLYPKGSVIPLEDRVSYYHTEVSPMVRSEVYGALSFARRVRKQFDMNVDEIENEYFSKVEEMYRV